MRTLVPLAAVLAVACTGTTAPVGNAAPTAVVSPWPSGSPTADTTTSPSASPDVTPAVKVNVAPEGANLSCRLPVTWQVQIDDGTLIPKAGFVTFPTGKLAEDASAPSTAWFYDRAFSKWLPVGRTSVSPDGRRYAYTEGNALSGDTKGKVHVVDVATGADKVLYSGSPVFGIGDCTPAVLYLTSAPGEGRGRGLWLQNPAGGAPRLITQAIIGPSLGGGAAWGF